jgi:hypothetical protein
MRKTLKTILIAGTLLGLGVMHAQEANEQALSTGKVIKLEVKFDGPDGAKITAVYASMYTDAQRRADQAGFLNNFPGEFKLISPGIFHAEFTIPDTIVTGDYKLPSLDARAPGIQLVYTEGQQYHLHAFHIENHNKFVQPPITIKDLH